jgi:hypothetical protein
MSNLRKIFVDRVVMSPILGAINIVVEQLADLAGMRGRGRKYRFPGIQELAARAVQSDAYCGARRPLCCGNCSLSLESFPTSERNAFV